ncbi:Gfo/Idh/MocA family protein [Ruegeria sp. PrR005]|uniref:Gfo/Idh/MocA family oxidoreductase n=1 Tax=Ruegeria sp. PrR005 TaxID=2706882 RepID=A0A6B2NR60_9RHOB|nr:Gfo/Idh/MocA family oxidoreductase [Ruegeria sp. PrR005]NDW44989.1 Gfo/Idh/MocA family oxidoreductase [Ruegeria sp. PrR005]
MTEPLFRWGILSTAKIAREHVMPAIARSETGVIHAIASRDAGRAQAQAARFSAARWYDGYDALLSDPDVDGVYIPLPTAQHVEWAIRAAEAGKHVLCEKPIALKADQIDRVIAARDTSGRVVSEAFMVWYHPQWHKVRDLIASGAIGALRQVTGGFSYHNTDPDNMRNRLELGGGALPDIGVYPVVTTLLATGAEMRRAEARIAYSEEFGTDFFARATVGFDGFDLNFHVATQMGAHQSMRFFGETGWIDVLTPFNAGLYGFDEVVLHDQKALSRQVFRFPGVNQYEAQMDAFVRATRGTGEVFPLEMSRGVQEVIDAIYGAAARHGGE